MRFQFRQGVPDGCMEWLTENVGPINEAWYYARITIAYWHTPCILIDDEEKATWFALRWL
jgi:hypothetical protein